MPSVATGANLGNQDLLYLGVSGDGDTAGIGIGQFMHAARRQLNITYIVENNGTYGLTKGQFSATNDQGSKSKYGEENILAPIDLAAMAIQLGAGFVGRSFSGDKDQLVPLLKAAMKFKGFSLIDIISPCVTFNNHAGSTKSYDHIREHNESVSSLDFVPIGQEIKTSYKEGSKVDVPLHDGAILTLEKLSKKYDPLDKGLAVQSLNEAEKNGKVLTGLLYINPEVKDHAEILNIADTPLNQFSDQELCPGSDKLNKVNSSLN